MPSRSRAAASGLLLLAVALLTLAPAAPARAERVQSDFVIVRAGEVVDEDLYAAGNDITIEGRVEGDLVASAWGEIRVSGEVTGDVIALAGSVVISGSVGESVRVVAGQVVVEGEVGADVVALARRVRVTPEGSIGRDLVMWAWSGEVAGSVGRQVEGSQRSLSISGGSVAGDVEVTVSTLTVGDGASIGGSLRYRSERPAEIGAAEVAGSIVQERPLPPNVRVRAVRLLTITLTGVGALLLGLAVVWSTPDRSLAAARSVRHRPLRSLAAGAGVVAIPLALVGALVAAVTLLPPETGFPLALVLAPLVLGAVSVLVIALLFAPVPVAIAAGRLAARRVSVYAAFLVGGIAWLALLLVPFAGGIVTAFGLVLGLGAWLVTAPAEQPGTGDDQPAGLAPADSS